MARIDVNYGNFSALSGSGVTGIASYLNHYETQFSAPSHAANSEFSTAQSTAPALNGAATASVFADTQFGGTAYDGATPVGAFLAHAGTTNIESSAGAATNGTVSGSTALNQLVYHFASHTLYGPMEKIELGDYNTANPTTGLLTQNQVYFSIENLQAAIGAGLRDNDSDGVYDTVLSRATLDSNRVHDIIYGLMGGAGANAQTDALERAFDTFGVDVVGTSAAEDIDSFKGNDILTGGGGADRFVFQASFGQDSVTDFQDGTDLLAFSSTVFGTAAAAAAATSWNAGTGTAVVTSGANTVTVTGLTAALTSADFAIV